MSKDRTIEKNFRIWYRPLCLYALHYLEDLDEAEDLVQDVFCTLWQKSGGDAEPTGGKAYLYTCVRNRCLDLLRSPSRKNRPRSLEGLSATESLSLTEYDDSTLRDSSLEEARMWVEISRLPRRCRRILLMGKVQGKKYSEIARELGISENTVRNQMAKALRTVREGVKKAVLFLLSI
ncbi:MAG: sigma-70 family RNA polymerase sigma factor [Bacteroidales bacterium]|nr:sigma-70 family RNA polymerase sigma factor [Bacteroidales bacterium]